MGGRGGSMGGSHGMGGGGSAGGAAKAAAPAQAAPQTRQQQLLAQIKGNPAALMQMSDRDALDTVKAIAAQPIATDGTQNDTFCQRWLNATGLANEMPEVLDDIAFGKARRKAGANKLYHSDKSTDGTSASAVKNSEAIANRQYGVCLVWHSWKRYLSRYQCCQQCEVLCRSKWFSGQAVPEQKCKGRNLF